MIELIKCIINNLDMFLINFSVFIFGYKVYISDRKMKEDINNTTVSGITSCTHFYFEGEDCLEGITIEDAKNNPEKKIMYYEDGEKECSFTKMVEMITKEEEEAKGYPFRQFQTKIIERNYYFVGGIFVITGSCVSIMKNSAFSINSRIFTFVIFLFTGIFLFLLLKRIFKN